MFIQFTFTDNSNPYIVKSNSEFFRMIKKYSYEQTGPRAFHVDGEVVYLSASNRKFSGREKARAALRDFAVCWQGAFPYFDYSYQELCYYQDFFEEYGKKYGMLREFRENGIC